MNNARKIILTTLCLLVVVATSFAQNAKEYDKRYENAMAEFEKENYAAAVVMFDALINTDPKNSHAVESRYFQAMCAFKTGDSKLAFQQFFQMMNNFPDWERAEDINYMLGNIAFENEDYKGAMEFLNSCTSNRIKGDAFNMKRHYLSKITNFNMMRALYIEFGDDDAVSLVYLDRLTERKFLWPFERDQLQYLKQTFDKDKEIRKKIEDLENRGKKNEYHVAALLPFEYNNLKLFQRRNRRQSSIDLYNGLSMALAELDSTNEDSISIHLHAYDTENDSTRIEEILAMPEMQNIDLIYGPIYKKEHEIVERFCNEQMICRINPLSRMPIEADSAFGLYFEVSMANLGKRAAEYCFDSIATENVFIAGYKNVKDTVFAQAFMDRFDSLGGKNVTVAYFNKFEKILDLLQVRKMDTSNTDAIVVCNGNSKIVSNVCSYYTVERLEIPILTTQDFVKSNQFLPTSFKYTRLFSLQGESYKKVASETFFKDYLKAYYYPPSRNSYIGYEMGWFYGQQLLENGKYFANTISVNESLLEGKLQPYFNYYQSNANSFVPVFEMIDFEMVPKNFIIEEEELEEEDLEERDYDGDSEEGFDEDSEGE